MAWAQANPAPDRPVIGRLTEGVVDPRTERWFREAMRALGHGDITVVTRQAAGQPDLLPRMAAELVQYPVDVIWTNGSGATYVTQQATRTLPIVMVSADAIGAGIVSNLARPGGNVTGLSLVGMNLVHKRLEMIKELSPRALTVIAVAPGPDVLRLPVVKSWWDEVGKAAAALQMSAQYAELDANPDRWDAQFARFAIGERTVLTPIESPFFLQKADLLAELSLKHGLPAAYAFAQHVQAGGLCSYGVSLKYISGRVAYYVSRIVRGAKAGDLPVELPTTYELSINMKTAKAMGLSVSKRLQRRADELVS